MKSLMVMQRDPESFCRIEDDLLKENNKIKCPYFIPGLLNWRRDFFRLKRKFLGDQLRWSLRSSW
jgi:phage host-nuclease inhibitor protein Gam